MSANTTAGRFTTGTIKECLKSNGPCITIVLPESELQDGLNKIRTELTGKGIDATPLLDPAIAESRALSSEDRGRGLIAVLSSPECLRVMLVGRAVKPIVKVADRFDIRTVLSIFSVETSFFLLALSQKRTRLLECTLHGFHEVALPDSFALSLADSKQSDKPDHDLENRSSAGPSNGAMKGVMFGTTTDKENKDLYLLTFFSGVDKALHVALRGRTEPLVVAAVESELALYGQVNTYAGLVEPGIHCAPDGTDGAEMHRRALELIGKQPEPHLADFDKKVGTGHASVHIQDIVAAAYEGRVSHLFFQENAQYEGSFDVVRQRVHRDTAQDLVDSAATETLAHGGDARILSASAMPNGVAVCALFRYAASSEAA